MIINNFIYFFIQTLINKGILYLKITVKKITKSVYIEKQILYDIHVNDLTNNHDPLGG